MAHDCPLGSPKYLSTSCACQPGYVQKICLQMVTWETLLGPKCNLSIWLLLFNIIIDILPIKHFLFQVLMEFSVLLWRWQKVKLHCLGTGCSKTHVHKVLMYNYILQTERAPACKLTQCSRYCHLCIVPPFSLVQTDTFRWKVIVCKCTAYC